MARPLLWIGIHLRHAIYQIGSLFVVTSEHFVKELLLIPI